MTNWLRMGQRRWFPDNQSMGTSPQPQPDLIWETPEWVCRRIADEMIGVYRRASSSSSLEPFGREIQVGRPSMQTTAHKTRNSHASSSS